MPCAFPAEDLVSAVRALLVPVDGPPEVVDVAVGRGARFVRSLRARIGAELVERFRVTDQWEFWADEDGRTAGKAVNQAATRVGRGFGVQFDFCGNVVITGVDDDAAGWADLSPAQVDAILLRIAGAS